MPLLQVQPAGNNPLERSATLANVSIDRRIPTQYTWEIVLLILNEALDIYYGVLEIYFIRITSQYLNLVIACIMKRDRGLCLGKQSKYSLHHISCIQSMFSVGGLSPSFCPYGNCKSVKAHLFKNSYPGTEHEERPHLEHLLVMASGAKYLISSNGLIGKSNNLQLTNDI
jgi:hypothetical protein